MCECSQKGQGYIGLERDRKEGGAGGVGESGREGVFFKVTEREREDDRSEECVCDRKRESGKEKRRQKKDMDRYREKKR